MRQVVQELPAIGKNVLKPKQFSKKKKQTLNQMKKQSLFPYSCKGIHTLKERPRHKGFCIRSYDPVYNAQPNPLPHVLHRHSHHSARLDTEGPSVGTLVTTSRVLWFCLAAPAILPLKVCWLCYQCPLMCII